MHLARGAEHVVTTVHHHGQIAGQVGGAGDQATLGRGSPGGGVLGQRPFGAEPRAVPGRHHVVDLPVGDEAVRHPDRLEDVVGDIGLEVLATDDLDDPAEDLVVGVGVVPGLTRHVSGSDLGQSVDPAGELVLPAVGVGVRRVPLQRGEATGVTEQLPDSDRAGGATREALEIGLHGGVEVDPARLDQLHHGQRGEALGHRAGQEGGMWGDRLVPSEPGDSARTDGGDLAVGDHGVGHTGHAGRGQFLVDELVDRPLRCSRRYGGRGRRRPRRQADAHNQGKSSEHSPMHGPGGCVPVAPHASACRTRPCVVGPRKPQQTR